tara:strand:+ start:12792 stop:13535 length:744 start_codon:yes stop_codon:yes gene_type:complete
MKVDFMFIDDAPCIVEGCGQTAVRQLRWSVGTKFCLCPDHRDEEIRKEQVFDPFFEPKGYENEKKFKNRVLRSGLPEHLLGLLGVSARNMDPCGLKETDSLVHARNLVKAHPQGVMVLSGHNGIGKSIAGAYAAWVSRGRFLRRSEWSSLTTWSKDIDELTELRDYPGVLVFDEVLQKSEARESPEVVKALNIVVCERHDIGKPTLLTTRASKGEFWRVFDNDIMDRSRQFEPKGSGFIEIEGSSLR